MAILRGVFWLVVVVLVAVGAVAVGARFHDGPIALFPGGPLKRGELVADPNVDWTFARDVREMELESDGRSRTVWVLVYDGQLYVPASTKFPPFKRWHIHASEDPRAVVRIAGKRYRRELQRIQEPELLRSLLDVAANKYMPPPGTTGPDDVWVFRLNPPREDATRR